MSTAVFSLGSNIGDRLGFLRIALDTLGDRVIATSGVYETAPWGVLDQPDFANAVVVAAADLTPMQWWELAQQAERRADRVRQHRWGPRTLDVDLVTVDDIRSDDPDLTLPHPRAQHRAFVLVPWLDLDPDASLPGLGRVDAVVARLSADELTGVRRTSWELR